MKKYISIILGISSLALILLASSCKKDDEVASTTQNIDEVINSNPDFSLFAYAVKKANLDIFTKGGGPFTFFIPSNSGFAALGINSTTDIDNLDPLFLAILTTYHFQGTKRTFYEIPEGPNASMTSQAGNAQFGTRYKNTDKAYINGVELLDKGTITSNGIYYRIAEALYPSVFASAIAIMQGSSTNNFSLMLQAIAKTATTTSFTTTASTVFIIPNSVMIANGYDSTTIANISGSAATTLTNILRYHVIPQRIFKSDFKVGNVVTRFTGNSVTISGTTANYSIKGKNNATAVPVGNGIVTGSGVTYNISQMLKP